MQDNKLRTPQHRVPVTAPLDCGDSAQAHSCFQLQTEGERSQPVCDVEDDGDWRPQTDHVGMKEVSVPELKS